MQTTTKLTIQIPKNLKDQMKRMESVINWPKLLIAVIEAQIAYVLDRRRRSINTDLDLAAVIGDVFKQMGAPQFPEAVDDFLREVSYDPDAFGNAMVSSVGDIIRANCNAVITTEGHRTTPRRKKRSRRSTP